MKIIVNDLYNFCFEDKNVKEYKDNKKEKYNPRCVKYQEYYTDLQYDVILKKMIVNTVNKYY